MADALIVPMPIDAMVVNAQSGNFIRAAMSYLRLSQMQSPSPAPFQEDDVQPSFAAIPANQGIYLQWDLPPGLRRATQDASTGVATFPLMPNRWLVIRFYRQSGAQASAAPAVTAWILQSDAVGATGTTHYLSASSSPMFIGAKLPLSTQAWQDPGGTPFLTAVAPANPFFTAYQPFNENVVSFHDDLVTQSVGAGTISYSVLGWYSAASADPLCPTAGTTFAQLLGRMGCVLAGTAPSSPAATSLFQGMVFGVPWDPAAAAPSLPTSSATVQVAVGNTSADALTAFVGAVAQGSASLPPGMAPSAAATLFEAFLYNVVPLLDAPGGAAQVEEAIRAHWFGSTSGGTLWQIVDAEMDPTTTPPLPPSSTELQREAAWLAGVNLAQTTLDANMRQLKGLAMQIYEAWWKQQAVAANTAEGGGLPWNTTEKNLSDPLDATQKTSLVGVANALIAANTALLTQVPTSSDPSTFAAAIAAFATNNGKLPPQRILKAVALPLFWQANDPVVVLSGTGHDETLNPDAVVGCRTSDQVLTTVGLIGPSGAFTVTAAQLAAPVSAIDTTGLPSQLPSLIQELLLLDPDNAGFITSVALGSTDPSTVRQVASSMATPTVSSGQAVPALMPPATWSQPWRPLFLDWEVEWTPIPYQQTNGTPNWTFDGSDYHWTSSLAGLTGTRIDGRSLLTPKPSFDVASRVVQLVTESAGTAFGTALGDGDTILQTLTSWDFLSQTLAGFSTSIALRNPVPGPLPTDTTLISLTADATDPPQSLLYTPPGGSAPVPPSTFEGMRGGQFYFNRLTVVDRFGQTLEVVTSQTNTTFQLLPADGLVPSQTVLSLDPGRFAELPPRLLQPARLDFQMVQGVGTSDPLAGVNPLIGWVLTNHLDGSLAVYGPSGESYGALSKGTSGGGQADVQWISSPNGPTLQTLATSDGDLAALVTALIAAGPAAFDNFVAAIDETLWSIDPLGARSDAFLSTLIGRPLALVRATLSLELETAAITDPSWPYTANPPAPPLVGYRFPIRLGDAEDRQDGLLGYFASGNYTAFNAVYMPASPEPDPKNYVRGIGGSNYVDVSLGAAAAALTLLVDPRAAVHAISGILPITTLLVPPALVDDALAAMQPTFRVGPVLVEAATIQSGAVIASAIGVQSPAESGGTWAWLELAGTAWKSEPLAPVDATAQFPNQQPTLREGLLQLTIDLEPS